MINCLLLAYHVNSSAKKNDLECKFINVFARISREMGLTIIQTIVFLEVAEKGRRKKEDEYLKMIIKWFLLLIKNE